MTDDLRSMAPSIHIHIPDGLTERDIADRVASVVTAEMKRQESLERERLEKERAMLLEVVPDGYYPDEDDPFLCWRPLRPDDV